MPNASYINSSDANFSEIALDCIEASLSFTFESIPTHKGLYLVGVAALRAFFKEQGLGHDIEALDKLTVSYVNLGA
jgi:hypothetical protein